MATTKLTRTMGTQGSSIKGTFSAWVKRASTGSDHDIYQHNYSSNYRFAIRFRSTDSLSVGDYRNGWIMERDSNRLFRDCNAWYHIYVAIDRSLATAGDRQKVYVNGERLTSFSASTDYDQQTSGGHTGSHSMNNDYTSIIGGREDSTDYFDGCMSHLYWVDGSVIDIAQFGSTDATTGEWKINTSPTIASYGENGHSHFKDVASINDASSEGNNFTLANGTLTKTEDNPSNVFATINSLSLYSHGGQKAVLEYGNLGVDSSTGGTVNWYGASTLGFDKGKFYWEVKNDTSSNTSLSVGVSTDPSRNQYEDQACGARQSDIATENYSGNIVINNTNASVGYGSTWTASGDVCMIAVDADNGKFYIGKNGVWADSDNPSTNTGGYSMSTVTNVSGFYFPAFGSTSNTYMNGFYVNFGGGSFGDTAISSAGTNASGNGVFEYDCPTNFTALSTKGLNI